MAAWKRCCSQETPPSSSAGQVLTACLKAAPLQTTPTRKAVLETWPEQRKWEQESGQTPFPDSLEPCNSVGVLQLPKCCFPTSPVSQEPTGTAVYASGLLSH